MEMRFEELQARRESCRVYSSEKVSREALTHPVSYTHLDVYKRQIVDKKRLEIARALATKPKLLMLDECMAGLNQTEIKDCLLYTSRCV